MRLIKYFLDKPKRKYPLIILFALFAIVSIVVFLGVSINITPSMKVGIYIRESGSLERGDIVALCLGEPYRTVGLDRQYIEKGQKCDGADPLIKQIIAVPGDNVILTDQYFEVNNTQYPYTTFYVDSVGRKLFVYRRGNYFNTQGYWMVGTNARNSWDSRYWGAVSKAQILYKLKPLLVWQ